MTSSLEALLAAVGEERARLQEEIAQTEAKLFQLKDQLKRHERVVNAAGNLNGEGDPRVPKDRPKPKRKTWGIKPETVQAVYNALILEPKDTEWTSARIREASGFSPPTVDRAIVALHDQGLISLSRKEGLKKFWKVVG